MPVIASTLTNNADEAVVAANACGGPVAMKIVSPDIPQKSDIGGVELSVNGSEQTRSAYERILRNARKHRPDAKIDGVLVSPMCGGGTELVVGVVRDRQWGLMLVAGLGGIFVEVLNDSVIVPLPISPERVIRALGRLRGAALFRGVRGKICRHFQT